MTDPMALSPDVVSVIAASMGAIVVKLFERYVIAKTNKLKNDHQRLQQELEHAHAQIANLKTELHDWQAKYWDARSDTNSDEHDVQRLFSHIKHLQHKIEDMELDVMHIEHRPVSGSHSSHG